MQTTNPEQTPVPHLLMLWALALAILPWGLEIALQVTCSAFPDMSIATTDYDLARTSPGSSAPCSRSPALSSGGHPQLSAVGLYRL